jgi:hypothetical protein
MFVHQWFLTHWIQPIETNLEPALESAATGFADSNILYACFSAAAYVVYLSAAGAELDRVVEAADAQLVRIGGRVRVAVFHALLERQLAQALAGCTAGPLSFTGESFEEERDLAYITATPNYSQAAYYYGSKLRLHYLYRDYAGAMKWAEKGVAVLPAIESQVGEWQFVYYHALAAAARAAEVQGEARETLLATARAQYDKMRQWAVRCESNFAHRRDLVSAAILQSSGEGDVAEAFELAVRTAEARGWLHDAALAHELAAAWYHASGDFATAGGHARRAAEQYQRWGAYAKAKKVRLTAGFDGGAASWVR